jgi:kynurenine formamidase
MLTGKVVESTNYSVHMFRKEYEIATDQMPEVFHECMTIMLSHDNVTLENINIREGSVKVVESDNYNPQWPEDERIQFAPRKRENKGCNIRTRKFKLLNHSL